VLCFGCCVMRFRTSPVETICCVLRV
jgi:hypothetical protein